MATEAVFVKLEGERLAQTLQEVRAKLDGAPAEVVLDFSCVKRIDPGALRAMEQIAEAMDGSGTKAVLRGVNVDIYKVLKLVRLAPRFLFEN